MVPHAYEDSVALMDRLIDAGRDVTLLTNWAADTFEQTRGRFPFLARPRGVTVSGLIKAIKPERAIYDHHAATFGLEPAATLFIDDSQKNVDGAISGRLAGGAVPKRQNARGGPRASRDRAVTGRTADLNVAGAVWPPYAPARSMPTRTMRLSSSIWVSPPLRS